MFEFFKNLLSKVNFDTENEELNKMNKIIYSIIFLCAMIFIGFIAYLVIKQWPNFLEAMKHNWKDAKSILNGF